MIENSKPLSRELSQVALYNNRQHTFLVQTDKSIFAPKKHLETLFAPPAMIYSSSCFFVCLEVKLVSSQLHSLSMEDEFGLFWLCCFNFDLKPEWHGSLDQNLPDLTWSSVICAILNRLEIDSKVKLVIQAREIAHRWNIFCFRDFPSPPQLWTSTLKTTMSSPSMTPCCFAFCERSLARARWVLRSWSREGDCWDQFFFCCTEISRSDLILFFFLHCYSSHFSLHSTTL